LRSCGSPKATGRIRRSVSGFSGKLKGCVAAKRIVQRDGEIFGVQARNFILPDDDLVIIVFTNRSADDFAIGEVWQQTGFAYDLLSAATCP
jgi:D-alanyl-D-alanine carboxypeptidase